MENIKYIHESIYVYTQDELQEIFLLKQHDKLEPKGRNGCDHDQRKKKSWKDKYKLDNVPKWFDDLTKNDIDEAPIIEINHETFPDFSNGFNVNDNGGNIGDLNQDHDVQIATKFTFGDD